MFLDLKLTPDKYFTLPKSEIRIVDTSFVEKKLLFTKMIGRQEKLFVAKGFK